MDFNTFRRLKLKLDSNPSKIKRFSSLEELSIYQDLGIISYLSIIS